MGYEFIWFVSSLSFHPLVHIYDFVSYDMSAKSEFQVLSLVS